MQRNAEGGYGFVYVADQNNVAEKQQDYEDKLEENRKLGEEQNKSLSDAIVQNRQNMVAALKEIRFEDYEDTEAYMAALEEVTRFY
jgi:hypothetical protein